MSKPIPLTLAALLVLTPLAVRAQEPAPALQLIKLDGRMEVRTPDKKEERSSRLLPLIPSGSHVVMRQGAAAFEADLPAQIHAKTGDGFSFSERRDSRGQTILRVAADDRDQMSLNLTVGGRNYLLGRGAVVSVAVGDGGKATIEVEGGDVEQLPWGALPPQGVAASSEPAGSFGPLRQGQILTAQLPPRRGFEQDPLSPFAWSVTGEDARTFLAEAVPPGSARGADMSDRVDQTIASWPAASRQAVQVVMEKYGPPTAVGTNVIVWDDNAPWDRTIVYRDAVTGPEGGRQDVIEQVVDYDVPEEKADTLLNLDAGIRPDRERGELSAVSDSEAKNFLALNVADEVLKGKLSPDQARALYNKTLLLYGAGKSSPLMAGLEFKKTPARKTAGASGRKKKR